MDSVSKTYCGNVLVVSHLVVLQEKASRIDRIVTEHQLFSQGLKELQNWVVDTSHMLQTYCAPTADKNVLDSRMIKLEVKSPWYFSELVTNLNTLYSSVINACMTVAPGLADCSSGEGDPAEDVNHKRRVSSEKHLS